MISNLNTLLHPVLCALVQQDQVFHLTGSRFFGGANGNSDWDFFTEDTKAVVSFLKSHGFEIVPTSYSEDIQISRVMRLDADYQFDIQLVSDVDLKLRAQTYLKSCFPSGLPGTKSDRKQLWKMAYEIAIKP